MKKIWVALIFTFLFLVINYTYSFFSVQQENNTSITGTAATMNLNIIIEEKTSSNKNLIPQLDAYITSAIIGENGSCIDGNNNSVCKVYEITIKNTSGTAINVDGVLNLDKKTILI